MIQRAFLPAILASIAITVSSAQLAEPDKRPPNVVVLLADDLRWDTLGYADNKIIQTPNIDQLARRSTRFRQSFVNTSICAISRASLITGQYESRHHIDDFSKQLSPEAMAETLPILLKTAGYRIGFIGKWGVGDHDLPEGQFDYWEGFPGQGRYYEPGVGKHLTDRMGDQAIEYLAGCANDRPFFLQISFKAPHEQDGAMTRFFPPAKRFETLYADQWIPPPPAATPEAFDRLPEFLKTSEARSRFDRQFSNPELYQHSVKDYYRLVTGVDDVVGRVMHKLKEMGVADRTVIVFTSDNGFCLGDRGLQGKWFLYEQSIRVPLIVHDPRVGSEGKDAEAIALTIDLAPTILDLAGMAVPVKMQGRSLSPILRGMTPADWREDFFYEHHFKHPRIPQSEGVRGQRWKYIRYIDREPVVEQLVDFVDDPLEDANLIGDPHYAKVLDHMRTRWKDLREAVK